MAINKIAELRKGAGLTQEELAETVDVSTSTVRNWETGRTGTSMFIIVARLCRAFDCLAEDLVNSQDVE